MATAGQAEDILLLGRVAILKDLPYGAYFELDNGTCALRAEYAALLDSSPSGARLELPADIYDAVLNLDRSPGDMAWDVPPGCLTLEPAKLKTSAILALPCIIRNRPRGILLFADDRRNTTQLRAFEEEIANRREAQASLRQATAALENASEGVISADSSQRIVAVNRPFTKVTGYEADEMIGKTPRVLQSGRHDPEFYATMWRSIRETGRWQGEIWNRRKDGGVYLELLNVSVVRDEAGVATHYACCSLT